MILFLNRMKMYHNVCSFDKKYHKEYLKADIGLIFIKLFFRSDSLSNHQIMQWCDEPHNNMKIILKTWLFMKYIYNFMIN